MPKCLADWHLFHSKNGGKTVENEREIDSGNVLIRHIEELRILDKAGKKTIKRYYSEKLGTVPLIHFEAGHYHVACFLSSH